MSASVTQTPYRRKGRPALRVLGGAAILVLAAFGWLVFTALSWMNAKPGMTVDHAARMHALDDDTPDPPHTTTSIDGYETIQALAAELARLELEAFGNERPALVNYSDLLENAPGPVDEEEREVRRRMQQVVAAVPGSALPQLLDEAARARNYRRPIVEGPLLHKLLSDLGPLRAIARISGVRFRQAAKAGDHAEMGRIYEQTLALARLIEQDPVVVSRLVGIIMRAMIDEAAVEATIGGALPLEAVEMLIAAKERQPEGAGRWLGLEGGRCVALDFVDRTHTDDGGGRGHIILSEAARILGAEEGGASASFGDGSKSRNILGYFHPRKRETVAVINDYYDGVIAQLKLPPRQRDRSELNRLAELSENLPKRHIIPKIFMSTRWKTEQMINQGEVLSAGTRAVLEIERVRAATGRPPPTLGEVPNALRRDPLSGVDFGYKVFDEPDAVGRRYLVYSFGIDGRDDGGTYAEGTIFGALRQEGADLPINTVEEERKPGRRRESSLD